MHTKLKYFLLILVLITTASFVFISCSKKTPESVVRDSDVRAFLSAEKSNSPAEKLNNKIKFLEGKVKKDNFGCVTSGMLGSVYLNRFQHTGNINDLITSDSLLRISNGKYNGTKASVWVSLSINALSRHEFQKSVEYAYNALNLGEDRTISAGILFDALIETGDYEQARRMLGSIKDVKEISYLIRASKYKELTGDIDSAVVFMQLALEEAEKNPTRAGIICWVHNSLAALYIKTEEFDKAYTNYLSSLKLDSNNYKALEGIASIASINDNNYALAEEILLFISHKTSSPDPLLNLYKIAKQQGDKIKKDKYLEKFLEASINPLYGKMYNRYLAEIYAEEFKNYDKAKQIAENEVSERPTPQSYFLLAWVCYKSGETAKAVEIIKSKVEDKTFDPEIIAKIDRIYLEETKKM